MYIRQKQYFKIERKFKVCNYDITFNKAVTTIDEALKFKLCIKVFKLMYANFFTLNSHISVSFQMSKEI